MYGLTARDAGHRNLAGWHLAAPDNLAEHQPECPAEGAADRLDQAPHADRLHERVGQVQSGLRLYQSPDQTDRVVEEQIGNAKKPSQNVVIDAVAADTLARANIEAHFVNGTKIDDVKNAILGKPHGGSVVKD